MQGKYRNIWMWVFYGACFLLALILQTVFFGKPQFWGVKLSLIPVCVACVAMHCGAEAGAVYGLVCGTVWCFSGADGGALHILLLTLCGMAVGYLCDRYLVRTFVSSLLCSLGCLFVSTAAVFLFKCYVGTASAAGIVQVLKQVLLSLLLCPLFYLAAWLVRKVGAD